MDLDADTSTTDLLVPEAALGRSDQTSRQYLRLRADILAGKFPQGSPLHETQLCESYGASRTPIREALNWLAHDGLLERAARGFRVRSGTPEDVIEIYAARVALESEAAGAAALRHSDLDLARLDGLQLIAGMPVEAFLQTAPRTVASFLVKPLSDQLARAFRGR